MLKLIIYQFQYSKRQWLGTIPLLFISSLIVGTSLFGITSASKTANINASQLFQMLIFFGGTTLFFLISNNIRLLIDIFKKDYQLWTILGASKSQLSLLVAGQFYVMAVIVSIIGTACSFVVTDGYYKFLQDLLGRDELSNLTITANIQTILFSVFIVPTIVGLGAYFYSSRTLKKDTISKHKKRKVKLTRFANIPITLLIWLICIGSIISVGSINNKEMISRQSSMILFLLIIHIFIIQSLSPLLQIFLMKLLMKIFPIKNYVINTAFWDVLYKPSYLKSTQASITIGITLISGFMIFIQNMYSFIDAVNSVQEVRASFIAYMSTPIILIITNSISLTILSSNKDVEDIRQLQTLGMSKLQILQVRIAEAVIHSMLISVVSVIFNIIILVLVRFIGQQLDRSLVDIGGLWQPGLIVLSLFIVFYSMTKGFYVFMVDNKS